MEEIVASCQCGPGKNQGHNHGRGKGLDRGFVQKPLLGSLSHDLVHGLCWQGSMSPP